MYNFIYLCVCNSAILLSQEGNIIINFEIFLIDYHLYSVTSIL